MKNLLLSAYALEHEICGVSDPFLQVQILHLLRILGTGHRKASDAMSEILAQVPPSPSLFLTASFFVV